MDLARILPLVCITAAVCLGALMYIVFVVTYRRQQESDIERKQRERRERAERRQG